MDEESSSISEEEEQPESERVIESEGSELKMTYNYPTLAETSSGKKSLIQRLFGGNDIEKRKKRDQEYFDFVKNFAGGTGLKKH